MKGKISAIAEFEAKRLQRLNNETQNLMWKTSVMLGKIKRIERCIYRNWALYRQELSVVQTGIQFTTTAVCFKWHIQHSKFSSDSKQ
jgi:hypothetical protein